MSSLPPAFVLPDFNISAGVDGIFVGYVLSTILLGITILQAWNYAHNNGDTWRLRSFVTLLVALDIGSTVFSSVFIHEYLIEHFGNVNLLNTINPAFLVEIIITAFVVFLVQLFFASRVHSLNPQGYVFPALIVIFAVLAFGLNIYTVVVQFRHDKFADLDLIAIRISVGLNQIMILVSDGIATFLLCMNFIRGGRQSRGKGAIAVLQNILAFTVTRGMLVTVIDIVFMIMFLVNRTNLDWMPLHLSLSKLYVITMLALLNARQGQNRAPSSDINSFHLSTNGAGHSTGSATRGPLEFALPPREFSGSIEDRQNVLIKGERSVYDDNEDKFLAV